MSSPLPRLLRSAGSYVDRFVLFLLLTIVVASVLPARAAVLTGVDRASTVAVCLLFFLHGVKLSPADMREGAKQRRLHLLVLATTFGVFPLLGLACRALVPTVLTHQLWIGVVFVAALPSTVQSSIAFTSIARGNVAAAICSASASNIVGVLVTPALLALMIGSHTVISPHSLLVICGQLVAPFVLGQIGRPWLAPRLKRHKSMTSVVDRGSILLVVYAAFSAGMNEHIWARLPAGQVALLALVCCLLLAVVLGLGWTVGRGVGLPYGDRIVLLFCGSKKSLVSGLPMATVLFPPATVAITVVPLMLFHMIQLVVCAVLARRLAAGQARPAGAGGLPAQVVEASAAR